MAFRIPMAKRQWLESSASLIMAERLCVVRPALDHLRDLVALGAIDRIYVHSPDRLARHSAYQVLLLMSGTAPPVEWAPELRQPVKTHFSLNGEKGHEPVSKDVLERV